MSTVCLLHDCWYFLHFSICTRWNHNQTLIVYKKRQSLELGKRVFFNFSRHSQNIVTLIRIHFSHRSSHYLKAMAESLFSDNGHYDLFPSIFEALMGQVEASQLLLHLPEQEEVRLREVRWMRRCGSTWISLVGSQFLKAAAVYMGVLSKWRNNSCSTITGLFFLRCYKNLPRITTV